MTVTRNGNGSWLGAPVTWHSVPRSVKIFSASLLTYEVDSVKRLVRREMVLLWLRTFVIAFRFLWLTAFDGVLGVSVFG